MPDAIRTLSRLQQAAVHLRADPMRQGNLLRLNDAEEVLVAGDLHGNLTNFRELVLLADLENNPGRHLIFQEVVHGRSRYSDGGDTSHQILDLLAVLLCEFPTQCHLLPGNHEISELTGRSIAKDGHHLNDLFASGVAHAYRDAAPALVSAYHGLFKSMPLGVRTANRVLITHSIPSKRRIDTFDPGIFDRLGLPLEEAEKGGSLYSLVWGRDVSEETSRRFTQMMDVDLLITGHIACPTGYDMPNARQVIVDCVGSPAGYVLFPARAPLTHERLVECAGILPFT